MLQGKTITHPNRSLEYCPKSSMAFACLLCTRSAEVKLYFKWDFNSKRKTPPSSFPVSPPTCPFHSVPGLLTWLIATRAKFSRIRDHLQGQHCQVLANVWARISPALKCTGLIFQVKSDNESNEFLSRNRNLPGSNTNIKVASSVRRPTQRKVYVSV